MGSLDFLDNLARQNARGSDFGAKAHMRAPYDISYLGYLGLSNVGPIYYILSGISWLGGMRLCMLHWGLGVWRHCLKCGLGVAKDRMWGPYNISYL